MSWSFWFCGEGGIRTLDSLAAILIFETSPFNHSGTSPIPRIIRESIRFENAFFDDSPNKGYSRSKYIYTGGAQVWNS